MTVEIDAAAKALATAKAEATRAESGLVKAQARLKVLADNSSALSADRVALVEEARAGGDTAALSLRLEIVRADLGDLAKMGAAAEADVTAAQAVAAEARKAVASVEWALETATADEFEKRLLVHAATLDSLLFTTIQDLVTLGARRGSRPNWACSTGLAEAIRRSDLNRANVREDLR
jgi:hypothetical protein